MTRARALGWSGTLLAAALAAAPAQVLAESASCLPPEFSLRVKFATPEELAAGLAAITQPKRDAGKREALAGQLGEAGCELEEQGASKLREPNLVCRVPGKRRATIVVGSSPGFDGWPAAALLPALARAVAAAPREHSYEFAAFARSVPQHPSGARHFARSLGDDVRAALYVHIGVAGLAPPIVGPGASTRQHCVIETVARAIGVRLSSASSWNELELPCSSQSGLHVGSDFDESCGEAGYRRLLDVSAFADAEIPFIGVYGMRERSPFPQISQNAERFDAAAYVRSYRLLAAYLVAIDAALMDPVQAPE